MTTERFPALDPDAIAPARDALHAHGGILGGWMSTCRARRKHWWHASLRPSLTGVTTGVIHAEVDFEIGLNFRRSLLTVSTAPGETLEVTLNGQPAAETAAQVGDFLVANGVSKGAAAKAAEANPIDGAKAFPGYSPDQATLLARALTAVTSSMVSFRAGIREESGPISIWPHHFDLSMLWLPGDKIPGQDPADEEHADKQMNFGFLFGDEGTPEPYFYVTFYPLPDAVPGQALPAGTEWKSDGFTGAVLTYRRLLEEADPDAYLQQLWTQLIAEGREHLVDQSAQES